MSFVLSITTFGKIPTKLQFRFRFKRIVLLCIWVRVQLSDGLLLVHLYVTSLAKRTNPVEFKMASNSGHTRKSAGMVEICKYVMLAQCFPV